MNAKEYEELSAKIANLAETAREATRAVSMLSGEIEALRVKMLNMRGKWQKLQEMSQP